MHKNFVVKSAAEIDAGGHAYDLHNFYDFREIKIDAAVKVVSLVFTINTEFEKNKTTGETLVIRFEGIDYFELSPKFALRLTCDLEEIGYKNSGDMNMDWLIDETKATELDHLLFRFSNDEFFRIYARTALFSKEQDS